MQQYIGYACILAAATSWGFIGSLTRFCLEDGLGPMEIAFWRMLLSSVFFLLHAARIGAHRLHNLKDTATIFLFGALALGGLFSSFFGVVQLGGAALAAVLLYTAPAWVALFSRFIYKETITRTKYIAMGLSLAGVIFISLSGGGLGGKIPLTAVLLGLLTGVLYSTHYVFTKEYLRRYSPITLYGFAMLFGAIAVLPFVTFAPKSASTWGVLITLAFVTGYLAYWVYSEGMRRLPLTKAAILATLEPVVATFVAWWIWGEAFSLGGWVGAGLIVAAVFALVTEKKEA